MTDNDTDTQKHDRLIIQTSRTRHYTVSQKNRHDIALYHFDADQPILIIFGRDVAKTV